MTHSRDAGRRAGSALGPAPQQFLHGRQDLAGIDPGPSVRAQAEGNLFVGDGSPAEQYGDFDPGSERGHRLCNRLLVPCASYGDEHADRLVLSCCSHEGIGWGIGTKVDDIEPDAAQLIGHDGARYLVSFAGDRPEDDRPALSTPSRETCTEPADDPASDYRRPVLVGHGELPFRPLLSDGAQRRNEELEVDFGRLGAPGERRFDELPYAQLVAGDQAIEHSAGCPRASRCPALRASLSAAKAVYGRALDAPLARRFDSREASGADISVDRHVMDAQAIRGLLQTDHARTAGVRIDSHCSRIAPTDDGRFPHGRTIRTLVLKRNPMAHVIKTVTTTWSPERAFAYMADFSHTAEWDPGVAAATRVDGGDIGEGSAFELTVLIGGRQFPMRYEVTDYAPGRVIFSSRSATLESVDTVTVTRQGDTSEVTYDARINFRGLLRIADPLLALGFRSVAVRAIRGLEHRLTQAV
jgi:Polyketide cyclase / dehydrase and lipid transport